MISIATGCRSGTLNARLLLEAISEIAADYLSKRKLDDFAVAVVSATMAAAVAMNFEPGNKK